MRHFAQAAAAQAEITVIPSRSAADPAAIVQANCREFAASDFNPALVLFVNHGCFSHDFRFSLIGCAGSQAIAVIVAS